MRVKISVLIALGVLLIASSLGAGAIGVIIPGEKTSQSELFAYPVYGQQDTGNLQQIDNMVKDSVDFSKDMYDSSKGDSLSIDAANIPFLSGDSIPGPMGMISAMAPAGYGGDTFRLGNHSVKKA
jgi:hypothetical protein